MHLAMSCDIWTTPRSCFCVRHHVLCNVFLWCTLVLESGRRVSLKLIHQIPIFLSMMRSFGLRLSVWSAHRVQQPFNTPHVWL